MRVLTFEEKEKRHERVTKFFQFVNYDWGNESDEEKEVKGQEKKSSRKDKSAGEETLKSGGTKEWEVYKDVNKYNVQVKM